MERNTLADPDLKCSLQLARGATGLLPIFGGPGVVIIAKIVEDCRIQLQTANYATF